MRGRPKGYRQSAKTRRKIGKAHKGKPHFWQTGKGHWNWKGNKVGYCSIHQWLTKYRGKKGICEFCGKGAKTEWALKKGKKYRRIGNYFYELCIKCHRKYDSHEAWNKGFKTVKPKQCQFCGKEFIPRRKTTKFCSNSCSAIARPKSAYIRKKNEKGQFVVGIK